jgi:hypothetical protein
MIYVVIRGIPFSIISAITMLLLYYSLYVLPIGYNYNQCGAFCPLKIIVLEGNSHMTMYLRSQAVIYLELAMGKEFPMPSVILGK